MAGRDSVTLLPLWRIVLERKMPGDAPALGSLTLLSVLSLFGDLHGQPPYGVQPVPALRLGDAGRRRPYFAVAAFHRFRQCGTRFGGARRRSNYRSPWRVV